MNNRQRRNIRSRKIEIEERRYKVSLLLREGYSKSEIARQLGVRRETIYNDLQAMDSEWKERYSVQEKIKQRRRQVAELVKKCYKVYEIADMLGVCKRVIERDIIALENEWKESRIDNIDAVRLRELAHLDEMERICIERLEKCTNPTQGSRWMEERRKIKEQRAKLLGLNAAQQYEIRGEMTVIPKEQRDQALLAVLMSQNPNLIGMDKEALMPPEKSAEDTMDAEYEEMPDDSYRLPSLIGKDKILSRVVTNANAGKSNS